MRTVRVGIPDSLDDGQPSRLEQVCRRFHLRMQTDSAVELEHVLRLDQQLFAMFGVQFVGERHDHIEAVVSAVELDHDENAIVGPGIGRRGRSREKRGDQRGRVRTSGRSFEERTAIEVGERRVHFEFSWRIYIKTSF